MHDNRSNIIAQLKREILPLQGFKKTSANAINIGWGEIDEAFPNHAFPTGAIHEFISPGPAYTAASTGFIAGIITALMNTGGCCIWISSKRSLFPPALKYFDIEPDKVIFIDLQRERDVLWAMEESLKCNGLSAVIGEFPDLSFTASRRLQLAVEQSQVTGFIIRQNPRNLSPNACITRWQITPLPSELEDGMPGIGYPKWNVELLKVRNGKTGSWQLEWMGNHFRNNKPGISSIPEKQTRIAG